MPGDDYYERPLFGGAISSCFPLRFQDVSEVREVPDYQEAFADSSSDETLIFELLDFKGEIEDNASAVWFLRDIAREQDAEDSMVQEHSGTIEVAGLQYRDGPVIYQTAVGQMTISKDSQGMEAQKSVRVYLANLRLKEFGTDVLITAYEQILDNSLSETGSIEEADPTVSGSLSVAEVFKLSAASFKVLDWNLFGAGA
ncbi:probable ran guanine nucleotide release factor [Phalaenopsis equestris]|uniref:probable ran guanine nucleotide release factor n=1 Tax=Phalaenopsis equestris TaxID=78828 RepID=UPI0009E434B8|nr:probable ran guanine nucleotide release factor [Phalaenopsis equestris]